MFTVRFAFLLFGCSNDMGKPLLYPILFGEESTIAMERMEKTNIAKGGFLFRQWICV
jgi:hypothetical protein